MFRQINTFKDHISLSEETGKPLIIHNVKAHDIILGLHRDLHPAMPWAIHGFRYKPQVAAMFADRGIYLSFGTQYNAETLLDAPANLILAETDDDSTTDIYRVISALSATLGKDDVTPLIAANTSRFLNGKP